VRVILSVCAALPVPASIAQVQAAAAVRDLKAAVLSDTACYNCCSCCCCYDVCCCCCTADCYSCKYYHCCDHCCDYCVVAAAATAAATVTAAAVHRSCYCCCCYCCCCCSSAAAHVQRCQCTAAVVQRYYVQLKKSQQLSFCCRSVDTAACTS
jgi:hypothetical protein